MSESYIVIDGKRIDLTPEQLATLGIEAPKKSPFERVKPTEKYYCIRTNGRIDMEREVDHSNDAALFNVANYCTDRSLLEQRALHEILNRRLWRYSMEHDGDKIDWCDSSDKYTVYMLHDKNKIRTSAAPISCPSIGSPYFRTYVAANAAIEEIVKPFLKEHPEFTL